MHAQSISRQHDAGCVVDDMCNHNATGDPDMQIANTTREFGSVAKSLHWVIAVLVITMIPLGIIANGVAEGIKDTNVITTEEGIAQAIFLFSLHKTLGVAIFLLAIMRVAWAIIQPRPGLLNAENKIETFAAKTVHWLLYGSLLLVPLFGWVHHAATTGFAPIWWPLGQSLPLVPKSQMAAEISSALHIIFGRVLIVAILLHVVGALKHHFVDRDQTLHRMLPGRVEVPELPQKKTGLLPSAAALFTWIVAIGISVAAGEFDPQSQSSSVQELVEVSSDWQVKEGVVNIVITQMGIPVVGKFLNWTAAIKFSEPGKAGPAGSVEAEISIGSLKLGSVTHQAKGKDFFDVESFPTAKFMAEIFKTDSGHEARGRLTIKDQSIDIVLPFDLLLERETATMLGSLVLDRLDFGIGQGTRSEATLAFAVQVSVALTAQKVTQ